MNEPLAYRVRPKTLEEYVGQEHVLGKDKILYRTIKADRLSSLILFGPPGCGKTSLAQVISETTKYKFYKINAVTAGVADIKAVIEETKNLLVKHGRIKNFTETIGYKEILTYLDGMWRLEEAVEKLKQHTRNYAKRQLTWFRKNPYLKVDI